MNKKIVLIEDEERLLALLRYNLADEYDTLGFKDAETFLNQFIPEETGVIITDVRLPGMDGVELLYYLKQKNPEIPVIIITAFGTIDQAVSSIKTGAYDYLTKPVTIKQLKEAINRALMFVSSIDTNAPQFPSGSAFLTEDPITQGQCDLAAKVSPIKVPVFILGETGTGKELIAEMIHLASKRTGKLVKINCAAIPAELLEGELFGYKKGAFTGAYASYEGKLRLADGGTLFLDEIGDMPESVQAKLLRVIESETFYPIGGNELQRVDIRLIAATNKDIKGQVENGGFRADLFYRLAVIPISIPPLRERKADIPLISKAIITELLKEGKTRVSGIDEAVISRFQNYSWPGNIRELRNVVTRMALLSANTVLTDKEIPFFESSEEQPSAETYEEFKDLKRTIKNGVVATLELNFIKNALQKNNWNVSKTAASVGIDRRLLQNMIKKHKIERP